jgi:hypothetical protein
LPSRSCTTPRREHVVPIWPECGTPMEPWGGPANIWRSFLAHYSRDPVPGVGRHILNGAIMPDGTVVGGAPSVPPIIPPAPSEPAPAVAKLSPKKIKAAIAKAKAAIGKGADRAAVHLTHVPGLVGDVIDWITATARRSNCVLALGAAVNRLTQGRWSRCYASSKKYCRRACSLWALGLHTLLQNLHRYKSCSNNRLPRPNPFPAPRFHLNHQVMCSICVKLMLCPSGM